MQIPYFGTATLTPTHCYVHTIIKCRLIILSFIIFSVNLYWYCQASSFEKDLYCSFQEVLSICQFFFGVSWLQGIQYSRNSYLAFSIVFFVIQNWSMNCGDEPTIILLPKHLRTVTDGKFKNLCNDTEPVKDCMHSELFKPITTNDTASLIRGMVKGQSQSRSILCGLCPLCCKWWNWAKGGWGLIKKLWVLLLMVVVEVKNW